MSYRSNLSLHIRTSLAFPFCFIRRIRKITSFALFPPTLKCVYTTSVIYLTIVRNNVMKPINGTKNWPILFLLLPNSLQSAKRVRVGSVERKVVPVQKPPFLFRTPPNLNHLNQCPLF